MKINKDILKKVEDIEKEEQRREKKWKQWNDYVQKCLKVGICPKCGGPMTFKKWYRTCWYKMGCQDCSFRTIGRI